MAERNTMESPREEWIENPLSRAPQTPEEYKELKKQMTVWEATYADGVSRSHGHPELLSRLEESIKKGEEFLDRYAKEHESEFN